ncbi:MAG: hypothetical protein C5B57_10775 [Blastocatellia bacterium]|nr:MAG: hypothetical protein C5B57_10775 [Blastocatellia bacterium]
MSPFTEGSSETPSSQPSPSSRSGLDPFEFLHPTIRFSDEDRQRLDDRAVIVRILPASGRELAALAAASLNVGADALVSSVHSIAELKKSSFVPEIGRFSPTPRLEDLRNLTLDDDDVDEIAECRPQSCGLKLAPQEIGRLQRTIPARGERSKDRIEAEFRQIVLERTARYLREGDFGHAAEFSTLLQHSPFVQERMPQLGAYLERYPAVRLADAESFLYWSKETYGWKPMTSVTQMTIVRGNGERGGPEVVIAARDVFSLRYTSGSLALTMLFRDPEDASQGYLVYINRTWVDGVRALWRPLVEHRIKGQAKKVFAAARERIERHGLAAAATR